MRHNFQLTNLFLYALIIHNHHIQQEWKQFHFTDTQVVCIKGGRHWHFLQFISPLFFHAVEPTSPTYGKHISL